MDLLHLDHLPYLPRLPGLPSLPGSPPLSGLAKVCLSHLPGLPSSPLNSGLTWVRLPGLPGLLSPPHLDVYLGCTYLIYLVYHGVPTSSTWLPEDCYPGSHGLVLSDLHAYHGSAYLTLFWFSYLTFRG
jgi:hypothetical protein